MFAFTKEDIAKWRAKQSTLINRFVKSRFPVNVIAGVLILALAIGLFAAYKKPNAYAVILDGQQIAIVEDQALVDNALQKIFKESKNLAEIGYQGKLEFRQVKVDQSELTGAAQLETVLRDNLVFTGQGTMIIVNGEVVASVASKAVANEILEEVKKAYLPEEDEDHNVVDVSFAEAVAFKTAELPVAQISSPEKVKSLLLHGVEQLETYEVVEGDTLWTIARANGMSVEELQAANPDLKSEKLSIGQTLKLVKTKPLLNVLTTVNYKVTENIPFEVKVERDSSLYRGQEKVKQPGVNGQKEVEYKVVERNGIQVAKEKLAEKVVQKPVTKVVARGTKLVLASRGDGGSGQLAWPKMGTITSGYGYRGREFHSGLDIDGRTGDPIRAAEDGVVTFSGWSGNYGYMIAIDHGDGLVTRYAHNSKNKVEVGDKVKRGEIIGLVGDTGRSTGSHVHFEVLVNGEFRNPSRYLK